MQVFLCMHIRDAHAVDLTDVYARLKEKEGKGNFRKTTEREVTWRFQGRHSKLTVATSNTQDDYTGKKISITYCGLNL